MLGFFYFFHFVSNLLAASSSPPQTLHLNELNQQSQPSLACYHLIQFEKSSCRVHCADVEKAAWCNLKRGQEQQREMLKFRKMVAETGSADSCTATKRGHQKRRANAHLIVAVWRQAHIMLHRNERAGGGSNKPLSAVNALWNSQSCL